MTSVGAIPLASVLRAGSRSAQTCCESATALPPHRPSQYDAVLPRSPPFFPPPARPTAPSRCLQGMPAKDQWWIPHRAMQYTSPTTPPGRARSAGSRLPHPASPQCDLELPNQAQPGIRISTRAQQAVGLHRLDPPEVSASTGMKRFGIPPSPSHPNPPDQQIQQAPEPPQAVPVIPPGLATDPGDRPKCTMETVHPRGPGITPADPNRPHPRSGAYAGKRARLDQQVAQPQSSGSSFLAREPSASRTPRGATAKSGLFRMSFPGLVPDTFDQLPPNAGVAASRASWGLERVAG